MNDDRKRPTDDEAPAELAGWGEDWRVPDELRDATLRAARARGLLKGERMTGVGARSAWIAAAAAAAVCFAGGLWLGGRLAGERGKEPVVQNAQVPEAQAPATETGPKFALFLFEDARYQAPAPERMGERVAEYTGWARGLAESGRYVTGEKLADDGRWLEQRSGEWRESGPHADGRRGVLTGYFIVGARDLAEAVRLARDCPHVRHGGTVEVRELEAT